MLFDITVEEFDMEMIVWPVILDALEIPRLYRALRL